MVRRQRKKDTNKEALPDPYVTYNTRAVIADNALVKEANEGMDALMVFAGLFSAVIATLIQITWSMLVPNPQDYANQVLLSIYNATVHEQTTYPTPPDFHPETQAVAINLLFFLSLVLSLGASLGAILVKEWARQYDPAAGYENIAWLKARDRQSRYEGYRQWPLRTIHASLPMLLHAALLLFLVGMVTWANQLHYRIYLTLLITAILGTTGYIMLAFIPSFVQASPFVWPLSQAIKVLLHFVRNRFNQLVGHRTVETPPDPSYIASPVNIPLDTERSTQVRPRSYTLMDAAVLIDLLYKSSTHEELEAAMDALMQGHWDSTSVSRYLVRYEMSIFQRYRDLVATCWDAESNCAWSDMSGRIVRLLRFLEWFYYQLNYEQRRQVKGWPATDLAQDACNEAYESRCIGDIVLAESVRSKLHHVKLPQGAACEVCFDPHRAQRKYGYLLEIFTLSGGQRPAYYYRDLLSACLWSDTDCVLHYARADGIEGWKTLIRRNLEVSQLIFEKIQEDTPSNAWSDMYLPLRSLGDKKLSSLPTNDSRREWFVALDRVRQNLSPFLDD